MAPLTLALGTAPAQAAGCTTEAGPHQKQVEKFLGRPVDGKQSSADCKVVRAFQAKHGITPDIGYAGPVTWGVMDLMNKQEAAGKNPNKAGTCPVDKGRVACVDLTRQLSWIQDGKKLVHGPVPVRTGRDGYETRTGLKKIYWRNENPTRPSTTCRCPTPSSSTAARPSTRSASACGTRRARTAAST